MASASAASLAGASAGPADYSTIEDCGEYKTSCGYCKGKGQTAMCHGMDATTMTVYDYQDLIDQGWRRSGTYLYKPNLEKSCCQSYTIRLHVPSFVLTKDQKRVLNKLDRYIRGELDESSGPAAPAAAATATSGSKPAAADPAAGVLQECLRKARDAWATAAAAPLGPYPSLPVQRPPAKALKTLPPGTQFSSACAFPLAAAARKLQPSFSLQPADIATSLAEHFNTLGCGYQAVAVNGHLNFISAAPTPHSTTPSAPQPTPSPAAPSTNPTTTPATTNPTPAPPGPALKSPSPTSPPKKRPVLSSPPAAPAPQPQQAPTSPTAAASGRQGSHAHAGPSTQSHQAGSQQQASNSGADNGHKWVIKLVPSSYSDVEYQLYRKYQMTQHKDPPEKLSTRGYKQFLVESPLVPVAHAQDASSPTCGYGSFHQQYWLDDKLVAVGVIDILPRCLSSVYLFWDPDFAHLAPGKLTALKEIQWVADACAPPNSPCPQLQYYYMGFYIPTCHKMRYKGEYAPSDLLCPRSRAWVRLTPEVSRIVDSTPYVVLSELAGALVSPNMALPGGCLAAGEAAGGGGAAQVSAAAAAPAQEGQRGKEAGRDGRRRHRKSTPPPQQPPAPQQQLASLVEEVVVAVGQVQVPMKLLMGNLQKEVADSLAAQVQRWTALVGPKLAGTMRYAVQ